MEKKKKEEGTESAIAKTHKVISNNDHVLHEKLTRKPQTFSKSLGKQQQQQIITAPAQQSMKIYFLGDCRGQV